MYTTKGMNVVLHPATQKKDAADVHGASAQPVSVFLKHLGSRGQDRLRREFPNGTLHARGATEGANGGNRKRWEKIQSGDLALFFRDKRLIGSGEVVLTVDSPRLAEDLGWGGRAGLRFQLIYVVRGLAAWDISRRMVWKVIGWKWNDQFGLQVLQGRKAERLAEWLEDQEAVSDEQLAAAIDRLSSLASTDREIRAIARKEQAYWRTALFGRSESGRCGICGGAFPVELVRAAHIKRRGDCTHQERLDRNNIMAACVFGCDALFEQGLIFVQDGIVRTNYAEPTGDLASRLACLDGKRCLYWNAKSARYFRLHRDSRASTGA